jgi:hypothetical protein
VHQGQVLVAGDVHVGQGTRCADAGFVGASCSRLPVGSKPTA